MGKELMFEQGDQHPYVYCSKCGKLAPVRLQPAIKLSTCLVCAHMIFYGDSRLVFLDKEEAWLRGLQVYLREDPEDED